MKVAMLSPNLPPRRCGVGDHAHRLAMELAGRGHRVILLACSGGEESAEGLERVVVPGDPWRSGRARRVARLIRDSGAGMFHFHYVPFLYGRRGISLGASLLPLLVRRAGVPVVTTLHELAMPWVASPGSFAVAAAQRLQLAMLVAGSDAVVATTRHRASVLRRWFPWKSSGVHLVPVGSTVEPDSRADRAAMRGELGVDGQVVLGVFGTAHPSKNLALVARCMQVLVDEGIDVRLLGIGLEPGELRDALGPSGLGASPLPDRAICTGWVPAERVSPLLAAVDVFLQPLVDGVSTLRTTTMAALAHGLAIVGTAGRETDAELFGAGGAWLVPVGDEGGFTRAVSTLARDPDRRAGMGMEARRLYCRHFAWEFLAEATLAAYTAAGAGPGRRRGSELRDG